MKPTLLWHMLSWMTWDGRAWKTKTRCWSAWDWGLVGQWKLKLTAPCCCIVLDGRSEKIVCVAQRCHCVRVGFLKKNSINLYTLPGILEWLSTLPQTNDSLHIHYEVSTFWWVPYCDIYHLYQSIGGPCTISRSLPCRGDSSVRGASGWCHAIGMAAGPGEFPGASKTYAISRGWRLVPTPWAKTRQKKGMVCFHWSCGFEDWSKDHGWKVMKLWFSKFHMEHGYYIADSYWKGKGAVFFHNVTMRFV